MRNKTYPERNHFVLKKTLIYTEYTHLWYGSSPLVRGGGGFLLLPYQCVSHLHSNCRKLYNELILSKNFFLIFLFYLNHSFTAMLHRLGIDKKYIFLVMSQIMFFLKVRDIFYKYRNPQCQCNVINVATTFDATWEIPIGLDDLSCKNHFRVRFIIFIVQLNVVH